MQTNLLWSGIEYNSLENCLVTTSNEGNEINSTIVGHYKNKIYQAKYHIKTNTKWETCLLEISYRLNDVEHAIRLQKDVDNNWLLFNNKENILKDYTDIDISITPFTNTLPINRLQLGLQEQKTIKVIYINVLEDHIYPLQQSYKKLSATKYLYQNVPNDFEAEIEVDKFGFVVNYPTLFTRKASLKII